MWVKCYVIEKLMKRHPFRHRSIPSHSRDMSEPHNLVVSVNSGRSCVCRIDTGAETCPVGNRRYFADLAGLTIIYPAYTVLSQSVIWRIYSWEEALLCQWIVCMKRADALGKHNIHCVAADADYIQVALTDCWCLRHPRLVSVQRSTFLITAARCCDSGIVDDPSRNYGKQYLIIIFSTNFWLSTFCNLIQKYCKILEV